MQGKKLRLYAGIIFMAATVGNVYAETLQPDPAWQQGSLANGFQWQVLATPHRPGDRIEIRLSINVGSLAESAQQSGYSRFLPHLAFTQNNDPRAVSLWQQSKDPVRPAPPVVVTYDKTLFELSLPNNRSDLLKESLGWLADMAGNLAITPEHINAARQTRNEVMTWPPDTQESWWRYRLKGSPLLAHDPAAALKEPVDAQQLKAWYEKWYTPDAMTLVVVGNVDSRSAVEQISKHFGELKGKRETPAPVPTLAPLKREPVSIMTNGVSQDRLAVMWDTPWTPIRDSAAIERYWRADLAREALFWHVQQTLNKNGITDLHLSFDCRVLFQRAQCGINLDSPGDKLNSNLSLLAKELAKLRDNGLPQEEFNALIAQKKLELKTLFAIYARTSTAVLMEQRLRSLQNQVVDIAPEQYQQLRQAFLDSLSLQVMNRDLGRLLQQDMAMVLQQPAGEPELNMKSLQATWDKLMAPLEIAPPSQSSSALAPEASASDIPSGQ
ncbi:MULTISPECIES: M16 family metallopeptidase [Tenebrionibacter/Tenebrionicola group]|jgi:predicted Zn-dependent peptidase|uniref:Insulinase family protein n=2 Tax=Tenebrionibacter/Tenebrionicola group TaxID=2969848 RepID=A0A8K0V493_9ENTR|nr:MULTISPECIES: pitrilysin family protein [Tenebrionibacter/Tenebrionicola group]MBK4716797.1 insulinase family protein [Tenebrionibacter intestinalis]MBV5097382.1 insulinase family protein [Tenebrionicola larvae]